MKYLIQENLFKEYNHEKLIETFQRFGLEYELFSCPPFQNNFLTRVNDTEFKIWKPELNQDYWVFGAVLAAKVATGLNIKPGCMYNANHDFEIYGKQYGENMLNADSHIIKFTDSLPNSLPEAFFARPTGDTKAFNGSLFMKDAWYEFVESSLNGKRQTRVKADTIVMVSPLKTIYQEIRCWCINGKIVTASQYAIGGKVIYKECYDEEIISFAQSMVDIYQPADAFVIDVCITEKGLKIVELNCINCAGFYYADMQKLIEAIEYGSFR